MTPRTRRLLIGTGFTVWIAVVGYGYAAIWGYAMTPGSAATAAAHWPSTSFAFDRTRPSLVTVLHPECVCSKATLEEVARLQAEFAGQLAVFAVVDASVTGTESEAATTLLTRLRSMPGVRLIVDRDGREVERFGAKVSGQTFLYDRDGRLRFSGGVTISRGHVGPNAGSEAIRHVLRSTPAASTTAVFGCALPRGGRA
jgi:hypothetical protein